jgi:hypothetical protein|tara:strand:+ start:2315 stop:2509 length:195 start_codon:yes stop_codon:yes gene_type:complete
MIKAKIRNFVVLIAFFSLLFWSASALGVPLMQLNIIYIICLALITFIFVRSEDKQRDVPRSNDE